MSARRIRALTTALSRQVEALNGREPSMAEALPLLQTVDALCVELAKHCQLEGEPTYTATVESVSHRASLAGRACHSNTSNWQRALPDDWAIDSALRVAGDFLRSLLALRTTHNAGDSNDNDV